MSHTEDLTSTVVWEGNTAFLVFSVKNENGVKKAGSSLTTLTMTILNEADKTVINGRDATNILADVDESGDGKRELEAADMPMVSTAASETHLITLIATYGSAPVKTVKGVVRIKVEDFPEKAS